MKYINKNLLDLDVRLNHEIDTNKNCLSFYAIINETSFIELQNILIEKNKEANSKNIASLAIRRFLERYRKKNKQYPKHCLTVYQNPEIKNQIFIYGVIFSENVFSLTYYWAYGSIQIEPLKNKTALIKSILRVYQTRCKYFVFTYISQNFGTKYQSEYHEQKQKINSFETYENEVFNPLPFANNYFVSNLGRVMSTKRSFPIIMKQQTNIYNQPIVTISENGKTKVYTVATLVAKAFLNIDAINHPIIIHHIDNNFSNNCLDNLKIVYLKVS